MVGRLRKTIPARSQVPVRKQYGAYKDELRADFNQRCGYCDDHDDNYGGKRGFQIDHFAPLSVFPHLKTEYGNLVYACPLCNRAKWNTWIGDDALRSNDGRRGFVDPCGTELDTHLARSPNGRIVSKTELGKYILRTLKLSLIRHELNWQIETLRGLSIELARLTAAAHDREIDIGPAVHMQKDLADRIEAYVERRHAC